MTGPKYLRRFALGFLLSVLISAGSLSQIGGSIQVLPGGTVHVLAAPGDPIYPH